MPINKTKFFLITSLLFALLFSSAALQAQPVESSEDFLEQRRGQRTLQSQTRGVHFFDLSTAFIRNAAESRREFTLGLRYGTPLWTSRRLWRLEFTLRASAQAHVSFRPNFYTAASLEGGLRFVSLSFLSVEFFAGPQLSAQFSGFNMIPLTGWGYSSAWLFHPFQDKRNRFRLGVDLANLVPFLVEIDEESSWFPFRHIGIFFGYQSVF